MLIRAEKITTEKLSLMTEMVPFQNKYFSSFAPRWVINLTFLHLEKSSHSTN